MAQGDGVITPLGSARFADANRNQTASGRVEKRQSRIQSCDLTLDYFWTGPCVSFHTNCQDQDVSESESDDIRNSLIPARKATAVPVAFVSGRQFFD